MDIAETIEHVSKLTAGDALHRRVRCGARSGRVAARRRRSFALEQVLVILIVNAMDAMKETPEGSRELLIRRAAPTRRLWRSRCGISGTASGANMPQLFDSMFTTKSEGMGLGLPIARTIVAAHGADLGRERARRRRSVALHAAQQRRLNALS